jgi:hypothetical protein
MEYKILTTVGEETTNSNPAVVFLADQVRMHLRDGWKLAGGLTSCSVVGPRSRGSERDNGAVRFSQVIYKEQVAPWEDGICGGNQLFDGSRLAS